MRRELKSGLEHVRIKRPDAKSRLQAKLTCHRDHAESHARRHDKDLPSFFPWISEKQGQQNDAGTKSYLVIAMQSFRQLNVCSSTRSSYLDFSMARVESKYPFRDLIGRCSYTLSLVSRDTHSDSAGLQGWTSDARQL